MAVKTIVTGASGHIGFHVARLLLEQGFEVHLLLRSENRNTEELVSKGALLHKADLRQAGTYADILESADALFHLAAENTTDTSDEKRVIANTVELTAALLETAAAKKVKTIIYTSSVVVLGRSPDADLLLDEHHKADVLESPYVKGKFLAERYCDELISRGNVDLRRLYPSWVVGDHDCRLTPPHKIILNYVKQGQRFYFKGGTSVASVEEVAKAHLNAWLKGKPNEKYVVAGDNITFKKFYTLLAEYAGKKPPSLFIPKWFVYCAAVVLKVLLGKKNPVDPKYIQSVIGNYTWYTSEKAMRELGYAPPAAESILKPAVAEARKRMLNLRQLSEKKNITPDRIKYAEDDVLLITGFPGWLGNRMIDIFMNGDRFGNFATDRKIKVLVQPRFKGLISLPPRFEIVYGDISDKASLKSATRNVKAVYHLAGLIYPPKISSLYEVNYEGTKNLVDACIENGVRRFLFMGTDSICGYGRSKRIFDEHTPPHPYKNYGKSKYLGEKHVLDKTKEGLLDGTSLRGFWFFGPFMPDRNKSFFNMFSWKRQPVFGDGKNYRSISHVDNITQAFVKAEKSRAAIGNWYWIGNGNPETTVDEIYSHIAEALGKKYNPLYVPKLICELFNAADSLIGLTGRINATVQAAGKFHKDIAGDTAAAQRDFGYAPAVDFPEIKKEIPVLLVS